MSMMHYVTESLVFMITNNMDAGSQDYHLEAAITKVKKIVEVLQAPVTRESEPEGVAITKKNR